MEFSNLFLLPDGSLRRPWRIAFFLCFLLVSYFLAGLLASFTIREWRVVSQVLVLAVATVSATWAAMRWLDHRPFTAVGFDFHRAWVQEAAGGVGFGILLAGSAAGIEFMAGWIAFHPNGVSLASAARSEIPTVALLLLAAASEELLFRGYVFQRVVDGAGKWAAVGIFSILFGVIHVLNPHATLLSVMNTMLAGVLLSLAYLLTRALWLPIGWHFAWNATLALAGLPVSGLVLMEMPWQAAPTNQTVWLHGGAYGPEGGLVTSGLLVIGIGFLLTRKRGMPDPGASPEGGGNGSVE
jgi:CAAX protease family protein